MGGRTKSYKAVLKGPKTYDQLLVALEELFEGNTPDIAFLNCQVCRWYGQGQRPCRICKAISEAIRKNEEERE